MDKQTKSLFFLISLTGTQELTRDIFILKD